MPEPSGGSQADVVGVLLAGGAGRRLGVRSKPGAMLAGRPLMSYPLAALTEVCQRVAVVCKRTSLLPPLAAAERWDEPDRPQHPKTGIVHALERAGGPVLVLGADMPFVTADACRALLLAAQGGSEAPAVVGVAELLQPLFAVYRPAALDPLRAAPDEVRLTHAVAALEALRVELPPAVVRSVNTRAELAAAEAAFEGALKLESPDGSVGDFTGRAGVGRGRRGRALPAR
jgi:molybdopterin-guanine dinucleotide biosynthesis protein A